MKMGAEEMAQLVMCLLHKHKDLGLHTQHFPKDELSGMYL